MQELKNKIDLLSDKYLKVYFEFKDKDNSILKKDSFSKSDEIAKEFMREMLSEVDSYLKDNESADKDKLTEFAKEQFKEFRVKAL